MVADPFDIAEKEGEKLDPFDMAEMEIGKPAKKSPIPIQSQNPVYRGAGLVASGFNRGLGNMIGLPADLINKGLQALGIGSQQPVMGSQWIQKNVMPQPFVPTAGNAQEQIANAIGEQIGGVFPTMAIPGLGAANLVKSIPQVGRGAIGAGLGSGLARTYYPENELLDVAAQATGGIAPTMARGLIRQTQPSLERNMMERAMKPSTTLKEAERNRRLDTALDEGITTTKGGLQKSKNTIKEINDEVQERINEFNAKGLTVNRNKTMQPSIDWAVGELKKQPLPLKPTKDIQNTLSEYQNVNPPEIPIRQAQDFKQSINKELDEFYKAIQASPDKSAIIMKQWTNKTKAKIADGLRKEIAEVFPEVTALNKREGSLIQLNKSLERAVNRISQHDILSLKGLLGVVTHPRYAVMNYVLNNPTVQSNLAVAIRASRNKPLNIPGAASIAGQEASKIVNEEPEYDPNDWRNYLQ